MLEILIEQIKEWYPETECCYYTLVSYTTKPLIVINNHGAITEPHDGYLQLVDMINGIYTIIDVSSPDSLDQLREAIKKCLKKP